MDTKGFLKGAAIGAIIASGAALLFAPQTGKKTRKETQKLAQTLLKRITKQASFMKTLTKDGYEKMVSASLADYVKGKKLTLDYVQEMKTILVSHFNEIKKELKK